MAHIYTDADADAAVLADRVVAIIGYGSRRLSAWAWPWEP